MAAVLVSFNAPVADGLGTYHARAVGRADADGRWEGWIEFVAVDGVDEVLVTPVESHQPGREQLEYWATGLTPVYLEGALTRARRPAPVRTTPTSPSAR